MIRVTIRIEPDDKTWLEWEAKQEHTSIAQVMRRAIQRFREESALKASRFSVLLSETSGICKIADALKTQRRLRRGWNRRY